MLTRKQAIEQAIGRSGLNQKELSKRVRIPKSTLSRKIKNPEQFTIQELEQLNDVLQFTDDEILAIMRGEHDVWF